MTPHAEPAPGGPSGLAATLAALGRIGAGLDLVLVRHGESHANAGGEFVGRRDVALHPRGHAQADAAAPLLATLLGPEVAPVVVTSPLVRAADTARRIAPGAQIVADARLVELDFGELEGRRFADLLADWPPAWIADPDVACPGGESYTALAARVGAAFAEHGARAARTARPLVVVSHLGVVKTALSAVLAPTAVAPGGGGADRTGDRFVIGYASISRIRLRPDGASVDVVNLRA